MKRNVTLTIEEYLHEQAKARGMNMSGLFEDALRERLGNFNKHILPENCKHEFTWPFCTPRGLVKECKICGEFKRVFVESLKETKAKYKK